MRTISDFKEHMLKRVGIDRFEKLREDSLVAFWEHLNRLGWKKKTEEVENTNNVDESAFLTDEEWNDLEYDLEVTIQLL